MEVTFDHIKGMTVRLSMTEGTSHAPPGSAPGVLLSVHGQTTVMGNVGKIFPFSVFWIVDFLEDKKTDSGYRMHLRTLDPATGSVISFPPGTPIMQRDGSEVPNSELLPVLLKKVVTRKDFVNSVREAAQKYIISNRLDPLGESGEKLFAHELLTATPRIQVVEVTNSMAQEDGVLVLVGLVHGNFEISGRKIETSAVWHIALRNGRPVSRPFLMGDPDQGIAKSDGSASYVSLDALKVIDETGESLDDESIAGLLIRAFKRSSEWEQRALDGAAVAVSGLAPDEKAITLPGISRKKMPIPTGWVSRGDWPEGELEFSGSGYVMVHAQTGALIDYSFGPYDPGVLCRIPNHWYRSGAGELIASGDGLEIRRANFADGKVLL